MNQDTNGQITTQHLLDFGFKQIKLCTFSNGLFDLIISGSGAVSVHLCGDADVISLISDFQVLKSLHNYNIISSIGIPQERLN